MESGRLVGGNVVLVLFVGTVVAVVPKRLWSLPTAVPPAAPLTPVALLPVAPTAVDPCWTPKNVKLCSSHVGLVIIVGNSVRAKLGA